MKITFIDTTYLRNVSTIDSNVDDKLLIPSIYKCMDTYILQILGTGIYQDLINQISANTLTNVYSTLLNDYVKLALASWVKYDVCEDVAYKYTGRGIVKEKSNDADPINSTEFSNIKQKAFDNAQYYSERLTNYLIANANQFSKFSQPGSSFDTVRPNITNYEGGIFIPNATKSYGKFRINYDNPDSH